MPTPAQWLGLCLRSESDQPHEWPALAWVVRNRVEARRFPSDYQRVITQPMQFSYFNDLIRLPPEEAYKRALVGYAGDSVGSNSLQHAEQCARAVIDAPRWQSPFSPHVLWFWAPGAMKPKGSDPSWAKTYRVFSLPNLPRWKFAEDDY